MVTWLILCTPQGNQTTPSSHPNMVPNNTHILALFNTEGSFFSRTILATPALVFFDTERLCRVVTFLLLLAGSDKCLVQREVSEKISNTVLLHLTRDSESIPAQLGYNSCELSLDWSRARPTEKVMTLRCGLLPYHRKIGY